MNSLFHILIFILTFLFFGCSENGQSGNSYITFGTSGITNFDNIDVDISFTNLSWDGEWDFNLPQDEFIDISSVPNQSIDEGTYEYMVTITLIGQDLDQDGNDDYIIKCSANYECPVDGTYENPSLIIEPNENGDDAPSLFEDGNNGRNRYYSFIVIEEGLVSIVGGF
tara:strand:- start:164 stop:667 length:504 start_codon:yes stop_codon:yes gene_type:complete